MGKWKSEAGPRQTKAVDVALRRLRAMGQSYVEIYGVKGQDETRAVLMSPWGPEKWAEPGERLEEIGERYGWQITRENHKAIIADVLAAAVDVKPRMPVKDSRRSAEQDASQKARQEAQGREYDEQEEKKRASHAAINAKAPAKAAAVVVAEQDEDKSDMMTDYHAHTTVRRVAIGWRTGKREDFRQLRRAAASFPETAHMGPGKDQYEVQAVFSEDYPKANHYKGHFYPWYRQTEPRQVFETDAEAQAVIDAYTPVPMMCDGVEVMHELRIRRDKIEHRENYAQGGGNYLKAGFRDSSGWSVKSYPLPLGDWVGLLEDAIPAGPPAPPEKDKAASVDGLTVNLNDERDGVEITFPDKPDDTTRAALKAEGFRWSRRQGLWWARQSPERLAFAEALR